MKKFIPFYYDTCEKLREIFAEHCNLSGEQYEEIRGQFIFLVCDIQEAEPRAEIEKRMNYMRAVFEFLCNTKELTPEEYAALNEMLGDVWEQAAEMMMAGEVLG